MAGCRQRAWGRERDPLGEAPRERQVAAGWPLGHQGEGSGAGLRWQGLARLPWGVVLTHLAVEGWLLERQEAANLQQRAQCF